MAEMRDSLERDLWEATTAIEMEGLINNGVWDQVALLAGEKAVGTKLVFKRKVDENGEIEKYKARFTVKGFQQQDGVHSGVKIALTPSAASIRVVLATAAMEDRELRHLDVEQAFTKADIDTELYAQLPEKYQNFSGGCGTP